MNPSVLTLQTIYFHESDKEPARLLGMDLYERLTRPTGDPLAYGPGIPVLVAVDHVNVNPAVAATNVLVPVLGKNLFNNSAKKTEALAKLSEWGDSGAAVMPVMLSENWSNVKNLLPPTLLSKLPTGTDDSNRRIVDELIMATGHLWEDAGKKVSLFITHTDDDSESTDRAARKICDYATTPNSLMNTFFDVRNQEGSFFSQEKKDVTNGIFIAVRGDAFSSRVWCQREMMHAKLRELPTLSVEVLRRGELRSSPYGGNGPSLVWSNDAAPVISLALAEWLRGLYFAREGERIKAAANLPADSVVMARPPELLDFAQGPLLGEEARLVLHPDPELSAIERRVLKAARPQVHLATPSTAFRRLLTRRGEAADVSSPLEGMQVAMSLSTSPDAGGPEGFTSWHVEDVTVHVARTLISCGAAIAYGGDFRSGGYTYLLSRLIQTYNQTASKEAQNLHIYLAAPGSASDAPDNMPLDIHWLAESPLADESILPKPTADPSAPSALYVSDMRRVMEKHVAARFVLGGNSTPREIAGGPGYGGRYPGLVEEAWRSLQAGHPLYVAGGFGGAAALVAALMDPDRPEEEEPPRDLQDKTWMNKPLFADNARAIDSHPKTKELGLPGSMEELAGKIIQLARQRLKSDVGSRAWNGLTVAENKLLFQTRNPVTIAAFVSKGLLHMARRSASGKLKIELIQDSITAADKLDVVAIGTLEKIPLRGAGEALDQVTGGTATWAHSSGRTLVSLNESRIDADWLYLASLGKIEDKESVVGRVEQAAADLAARARQHGFQRVGVVSFGGNLLPQPGEIALAMVEGLGNLPDDSVVLWYENDTGRFERLSEVLGENSKVQLTTRRAMITAGNFVTGPEPLILTVELQGEDLKATVLPPSSAAVVSTVRTLLSQRDLERLSEGIGASRRATPGQLVLEERGLSLGKMLLGENAAGILAGCPGSRLVIVHDSASARIPFEMLLANPDSGSEKTALRPALLGGITRRLSVSALGFGRQFSKPLKKGRLKVLLVLSNANPGQVKLPGAEKEAEAVRKILSHYKDKLELVELWNEDATVEKFSAALARADVLHYCGHAFFDGPGEDQSGLILTDNIFTGVDLAKVDPLPRVAFVNACEGARVRSNRKIDSPATAFAELFLQSGVDAYLGTFWEVEDQAAGDFASSVYTELAAGMTLEQAVLASRNKLFTPPQRPDWANYMLFGGSNFRLVTNS